MKISSFLFLEKVILKFNQKNVTINVFEYENKQEYSIYLLKDNLEEYMKLLLLENKDNLEDHHVKLLLLDYDEKV